MHIECEAISSNHTFCINTTSVKRLFENYEIDIYFNKGSVLPYKNAKIVPEKSAKYEVAILRVSKPRTLQLVKSNTKIMPRLNLYSINKKYLSEQLKEQFAREIMHAILNQFISHQDDDYEVNGCEYSMSVYIADGEFVIEENNKYSF